MLHLHFTRPGNATRDGSISSSELEFNQWDKEANRWEEQFFLGMDEDAVIEYGTDPNRAALFDELMVAVGKFGKPQLASHIGISRNSLAKILDLKCQNPSPRISRNVRSAIIALNSRSLDEENQNSKLLQLVRVEIADIGLSEFARRLQIDASNLSKVMDGTRKLSRLSTAKFERYFSASPAS